jgi:pimeloyl-ACP methyl ester carboxylesterase
MGSYVDLDGVKTWYDEQGSGEPLVLLHHAMGDARAFEPNIDALASEFRTFLPERRGHGHTPDIDGPYSYELMADDTIAFIETVVGGPTRLMGHSDGSIVALLVALKRPDLVRRLACVAGVFHRDGWSEGDFELPESTATTWAEVSPHDIEHFPAVVAKLYDMYSEPTLTEEDLGRIECPALVMAGDHDEVRLEHAIAFYRGIPGAELAIVPGSSHWLLAEKPDLCSRILIDFLTLDPAQR